MKHMNFYHWVYIWLLLSLGVGRLLQKVLTDTGGFASRYLPLLGTLILIAVLIGYVEKKPLARRWLWQGMFWVLSSLITALLLLAVKLMSSDGGAVAPATWLVLGLLLMTPALIAMYLYVFRSPEIWRQPTLGQLGNPGKDSGAQ